MKIMVNFSENEIVSTLNTVADVSNECASSIGSANQISAETRNRAIRRFRENEFYKEHHSPAVDITMDCNILLIDIKDDAYLDALNLFVKVVKIFTPFLGGLYNLYKGLSNSAELLKGHFGAFNEKWSVKEDDKKYVVIPVAYEGMRFHVVCCYDGYNKNVCCITSDSNTDAARKFEDVLYELYDEKVGTFDNSVFMLTKEEADKKAHEW